MRRIFSDLVLFVEA